MNAPRLRDNILALGVVQAANSLIPLLVLPYMARVLGPVPFGQVVFVQTVMAVGVLIVDFGFSWSATRHIAQHRDDVHEVSRTFFATWAAQWLLALVLLVVMLIGLFLWPQGRQQAHLYLVASGLVIGQVLFPLWLFQGLEQIKTAAVMQVLTKLCALPFAFLWVRTSSDAFGALAYFSLSALLAGPLSWRWIARSGRVVRVPLHWGDVWQAFRDGALLFGSRISISLYTYCVSLALGLWAGPAQLAYFNLADKVKTAIQAMLTPLSQALFPRVSALVQSDRQAARRLLKQAAWGIALVTGGAGLVVWFGADLIVLLLGGEGFADSVPVLRWLAFVPIIIGLSNLLGVQIMLPLGMHRPFAWILSGASVLSLVCAYPLIHASGARGAAQLVMLTECMVTATMIFYLWRRLWKIKN